ncbi:MAG: hypothetical protein KJO77_06930 [Bacteroidia bacterium]|nr:hypothetical protein [Bacteroidia bacterium]NND51429.1 hypothetical protein [Flavobacteriaceae bacterium]
MRLTTILIFLLSVPLFSQDKVSVTLQNKLIFKADQLIEIDNFNTTYHVLNNTLFKTNSKESINYSNVQMGGITSANAFNPLKIPVFYQNFNTVIILDNRLAEITRIDFNARNPFRVVTHISSGNDNTFWLFNQNTQQIELFDYLANKSRVRSLPIKGEVFDLDSNYNFCWLLTEEFIYVYNYIGSLIDKFPNDGFTSLDQNNGNLFFLKENQLYVRLKNATNIVQVSLPELLIKQFLVTDESLYIYDGEYLHQYLIKTN